MNRWQKSRISGTSRNVNV